MLSPEHDALMQSMPIAKIWNYSKIEIFDQKIGTGQNRKSYEA